MDANYITIPYYLECRTTLADKIKAIDSVISAMELKLIDTAESVNFSEYNLDDGQMKIKTAYRSPEDVIKGINSLETLKQRYINRLNGRVSVLRGGNL